MESLPLQQVLSILCILGVGAIFELVSKKIKMPLPILLVTFGIFTAFLASEFHVFEFLTSIQLTPELVYYLFLPILIFESAFHLEFNNFKKNFSSILSLSTFGYFLSVIIITLILNVFTNIPLPINLLFAAVISATDPIAVIAQFKKAGAPKDLKTIVEGESLFNDGTSLVFFAILYDIFSNSQDITFSQSLILGGVEQFIYTVAGGILVGIFFGYVFSKILKKVETEHNFELSITLILAHITFITAEAFLGVSGIIATVIAGIILGNYGRHKISPKIYKSIINFWDYLVFVTNIIVFTLVGQKLLEITGFNHDIWNYLIAAIPAILIARAFTIYSIFGFLNTFKISKIPLNWQHIIQWGGLRGALPITLILSISTDFPGYEILFVLTVGAIAFTLLVNGLSIAPLLKKLGFFKLTPLEKIQLDETQVFIDQAAADKLNSLKDKHFIDKKTCDKIQKDYNKDMITKHEHLVSLLKSKSKVAGQRDLKKMFTNYLLGIEAQTYEYLYEQDFITEKLLTILTRNINEQRIKNNLKKKVTIGCLTSINPNNKLFKQLTKFKFFKNLQKSLLKREISLRYEMYKARVESSSTVLCLLKNLSKNNIPEIKDILKDFQKQYEKWNKKAQLKLKELEKTHPGICQQTQDTLANWAAIQAEKDKLKELKKQNLASEKVVNRILEGIEKREKIHHAKLHFKI